MAAKRIPAEAGDVFIAALARGCSAAAAAEQAGVARRTAYGWRANPAFLERWTEAIEAATDLLEDEARRRAVEGVEKPVYRAGKLVGNVRDMSDRLLMALLAARRPERFHPTRQSVEAGPTDGEHQGARASLERKLARLAGRAAPALVPEEPQ